MYIYTYEFICEIVNTIHIYNSIKYIYIHNYIVRTTKTNLCMCICTCKPHCRCSKTQQNNTKFCLCTELQI